MLCLSVLSEFYSLSSAGSQWNGCGWYILWYSEALHTSSSFSFTKDSVLKDKIKNRAVEVPNPWEKK